MSNDLISTSIVTQLMKRSHIPFGLQNLHGLVAVDHSKSSIKEINLSHATIAIELEENSSSIPQEETLWNLCNTNR